MSRTAKVLLLVEVAVCFLPVMLLLLVGAVMVPLQVGLLAGGEFAALFLIVTVLAGFAGLVALISVLRWLLVRPDRSLNPKVVLVLMACGLVPILPIAVAGDTLAWKAVGAIPLICAAHVAYLARARLFGSLGLRSGS